ncbi:MAG TPA: acyltransferase [Acidimicrobiales bacterium]|nr:acyltransferase [Acidimicrobiales bacterium]
MSPKKIGDTALVSRLRRITTGGDYVPEVDGVRFIAIAMVMFHHINERVLRRTYRTYPSVNHSDLNEAISAGALGVVVFFALSGYVLYQLLVRRIERNGNVGLKAYFTRRLTRLEPPYVVVMVGIFAVLAVTGFKTELGVSFERGADSLLESLLASLTYTYGLIFGALPKLNPPAWSLEVEIQFYLLAPLLTLGVLRLSKRPATRLVVLLAVMLTWPVAVGAHMEDYVHLKSSLLRFFSYFIAGFAAAEWGRVSARWADRGWLPYAYDGAAVVMFVLLPVWNNLEPLWFADMLTVTTALLVLVAALQGGYVRRFAALPWVATIGGMCYSIYLIHLPLLEFASNATVRVGRGAPYVAFYALQVVLLTALVMAVAVPFFLMIERPCMQPDWPARLRARVFRPRQEAPTARL